MTNDGWGKPPETNSGWGTPAPHNWGKAVDIWPTPTNTQAAPPPNTNDGWGNTNSVGAPLEWGTDYAPNEDDVTRAVNEAGLTVAFDIPTGAPMDKPADWDTKPLGAWDGGTTDTALTGDWDSMKDEAFQASGWGAAAGFQPDEPSEAEGIIDDTCAASGAGCNFVYMERFNKHGCEYCGRDATADEERELQAGLAYQAREDKWTHERRVGAEERTRALNAINQERGQEWSVDQDGQLDRVEKPTKGELTGFYVAYQKPGALLHAYLSGPYPTPEAARLWEDATFDLLIQDAAYKLAFENVFVREGIYIAELSRSRGRTAFGVLA